MANGVPVWSMTAASNSTADDSINWAESQAPSSVNDSARAMMARIAEWYADTSGNLVLGGTSTAYTLTTNNATGALLINSIWAFTYDSTDDAWIAWGNTLAAGQLLTATDITGATTLTAPAIDDELPTYDLSATANRKITTVNLFKVVATFAAETSPAIDDELLLYDLSTTTADKITTANLLKVINGLTEDTSPHVSNDFLVTYDASATAAKKLTLTNLVAAFLTAGLTSRNTAKAVAFFSVSAGVVSFTSGNWFNVASITRTGTGAFTVTFTNALSSANYVLTGGGIPTSSLSIGTGVTATSKATTGFTLNTFRMGAGAEDPLECDFAII